MKTSKYSDSQIIVILNEAESGTPIPELCRGYGMSSATFYKWHSKYGGMDASLMKRLKELEDENLRFRPHRIYRPINRRFAQIKFFGELVDGGTCCPARVDRLFNIKCF